MFARNMYPQHAGNTLRSTLDASYLCSFILPFLGTLLIVTGSVILGVRIWETGEITEATTLGIAITCIVLGCLFIFIALMLCMCACGSWSYLTHHQVGKLLHLEQFK